MRSTDQLFPDLTEEELVNEIWRVRIDSYAATMSRGQWVPYAWLRYLLLRVKIGVINGGARIIVTAPPRHGKSEGISHWLPTWFLDWFPDQRVILGSYGQDFAKKWGRKTRNHFLEGTRSYTRLHKDQTLVTNWLTEQEGGMRSVGLDGTLTGEGFNLGIIDDPHKSWVEAMSPTQRQHVIDWYNGTFYTRAEPGASIILMTTRWHERDLAGYLISESDDEWEVINLPALAEANDVLGRKAGEALCPERFDEERLWKIKKVIGSHMFNALYQQRPAPPDGGMIKRGWFKRWASLPNTFDEWLQSWDLTFSETGTSYVVGQVWGRAEGNCYLVDQVRAKLSFPETLKRMGIMAAQWPEARTVLVENKANGPAVIATLKDKVPGIIAVNPAGSKEARLAAVSGMIESGNVYVPESIVHPWADDFIEEVVTFPAGHDDQLDSMTQALDRLRKAKFDFNINLSTSGSRSNPWEFANGKVR